MLANGPEDGAKAPFGKPIPVSDLPKELQGIAGLQAFSNSGEDGFRAPPSGAKPIALNDLPEELRNIPGIQAFEY